MGDRRRHDYRYNPGLMRHGGEGGTVTWVTAMPPSARRGNAKARQEIRRDASRARRIKALGWATVWPKETA